MKNLLSLVSAATIITASVSPVLNHYTNSTIALQSNNEVYAPDTVENLIKTVNNTYLVEWIKGSGVPTMQNLVQKVYNQYITNQKGSLYSQKTIATDEKVVQTFNNTYTNNSTKAQTFYTQSFSETITNQYNFSWKMTEKLSAKTNFNVPFIGGTEFNAEISSEQQTTNTIINTETLTNPSQSFVVSPNSLGTVLYVIKQGNYHNEGVIRFNINLNDKINGSYYRGNEGKQQQAGRTFKDLIWLLSGRGFANQLKNTSTKFSVLSTDNPENPTSATLNLPVTWNSQGGKLDVTFTEKTL